MRLSLFLLLAAGSALAAPPDARARPRFVSPQEMIKLMEASPRKYEINSEPNPYPQWTQQNAALAWPQSHPPIPVPVIATNADGSKTIKMLTRAPEVDQLLEKVEPLFEAKDWEGAEKGYGAILEKFPDDYGVQLDWGDAALFAGKAAVALPRYEKATRLNPSDHRSWYYRGNALAVLGRKKEAIDAWVRALAMTPANGNMLEGLEVKAPQLGYVVNQRTLLPQARVSPIPDGHSITVGKNMHWLAWGICKAMWRGEPSHRKEQTGSEDDVFSITEEKECLVQLATMYEKRKKGEAADPVLDHLLSVIKAGQITGYLIYEIASRVEPQIYLQQTPETQRAVEDYVRKYVLVPARR